MYRKITDTNITVTQIFVSSDENDFNIIFEIITLTQEQVDKQIKSTWPNLVSN